MGLSIGPVIGVEGAEKFQLAFKEMAATAGMLQSQMDAVTASFRDTDSAMSKSKQMTEQLTAQVFRQQRIYDEATRGYEKAKQAVSDASRAIGEAKDRYAESGERLKVLEKNAEDANKALEDQKAKAADATAEYKRLCEGVDMMDKAYSSMLKPLNEAKAAQQAVVEEARTKWHAARDRTNELAAAYGKMSPQARGAREATRQLHEEFQKESRVAADIQRQIDELSRKYGRNTQEYKAAAEARANAKAEMNAEKKAVKEAENEVKAHNNALKAGQKEHEKLAREVGNAEKRFDVAKITLAKWGDVMYTAKAKLIELQHALEEAGNKLSAWADDCVKSGETISQVGEGITKLLSPFTALTAFGVKGALTFTDALAKISTIADTTKVSLEEFGDGIKKIASETGFATSDIAAATYQALSAAVSTEDSLEFVAGAADLARAGFLDMYGSVDVLTTILNAYHKDVSEVAHISDVLVKVQDRGKTTVNELAASMGNVIPTAAQYGIKLEDLGAAYVVLTRQGINTARTTTYLRSAFTELEKDGSDASKALQEATGKTFVQLLANGKSLGQIMQILKDQAHGDEEEFIHMFGSIRTAAGALALANTSASEYAEILEDVGNSNGQAARNVEKLQTPALKLKKIWEQLKTTGLDLGEQMLDVLIPYLDTAAKKVKEFTDWFKSLHKSTKRGMAIFAGIAGAIGPMTVGIGKAVIGVGKFAKAMSLLFKVTVPMIATFGGIATAVLAVAGALGALALKRNEAIEDYKDMIEETYGLTEEMKNHLEVTNDLIEANKGYRQATIEKAEATQADTAMAAGLLEQLRKLYDKNGEVTEGNRLNAEIIKGQLAEALHIEADQIDDLIKKNGIFSSSIDNLIETQKKQAEAEVYLESYKEQYKTMVDLQRQRKTVTEDMVAADEEWHKVMWQLYQAELSAEESRRKGIPLTQEQIARRMELTEAEEKSRENLTTLKQSYDDINAALGTSSEDMEFYIQKLMEVNGMTREEAEKAAQEMVADITTVPEDVGKTVDEITKRMSGGYEAWKKDAEAYRKENQVNLQGVNTDTDTELTAYENRFENARATVGTTVGNMSEETTTGLNSGVSGAEAAAGNIVDGFVNKLISEETRRKIQEAYSQIGKWGDGAFKKEEGIKSPSKVWARYADYIVDGHLIGLNNRMSDIQSAYSRLAYEPTADTSWTSNYSRLPDYAYGTTNNTRNISAPIAVNVNVNGNVDDPNGLADIIEQRLVEKIINNERAFA